MTERMRAYRLALAAGLASALFTAPLAAQSRDRWGELPYPAATQEPAIATGPRHQDVPDWPAPPLTTPPHSVRAIYLNAWVFGGSRFYDLLRLADSTEINSFVIDVKDDTGYLTYPSQVPTAIAIGANQQIRARDTRARLRTLIAHGIHPIARIVVAKDPLLASKKVAWSVQDTRGGLWHDRLNFAWVDAFNDSVWVYAAQLGEEAVKMGFAEVQFDYVRFPDEPRSRLATAIFAARRPGETVRDGVHRNLKLLRDRVKPLGVPFTIDVFGMTTNVNVDMGIGQIWEDLVGTADVVLPMVYPSHYYRSMYGVAHPNDEPYTIVRHALEDGLRRSEKFGPSAEIRPYLQAFTLGKPRYTPDHIRAQIRAASDVGIDSWVLWNPRGVYDRSIFLSKHAETQTSSTSRSKPSVGSTR
ncbi:MAG: putative glycoside hydrolase [Gemmatimonadota bacterium]